MLHFLAGDRIVCNLLHFHVINLILENFLVILVLGSVSLILRDKFEDLLLLYFIVLNHFEAGLVCKGNFCEIGVENQNSLHDLIKNGTLVIFTLKRYNQ